MCHMPLLSHSSWFSHPNDSWWKAQIMKFCIMLSSPLPYYLVPPRFRYFC
jgi:hypothetical protein